MTNKKKISEHNIKLKRMKSGIGDMPDPFGREFVFYATYKGVTSVGDTALEAFENLSKRVKFND